MKEKDRYGVYDEVNDERAMIARLEEENEEMLREMEHLKQQVILSLIFGNSVQFSTSHQEIFWQQEKSFTLYQLTNFC